jgi:hypothetical protein
MTPRLASNRDTGRGGVTRFGARRGAWLPGLASPCAGLPTCAACRFPGLSRRAPGFPLRARLPPELAGARVTPLEQRSTDTTCGCAARFRECRRACRTRSLRASPCAGRRLHSGRPGFAPGFCACVGFPRAPGLPRAACFTPGFCACVGFTGRTVAEPDFPGGALGKGSVGATAGLPGEGRNRRLARRRAQPPQASGLGSLPGATRGAGLLGLPWRRAQPQACPAKGATPAGFPVRRTYHVRLLGAYHVRLAGSRACFPRAPCVGFTPGVQGSLRAFAPASASRFAPGFPRGLAGARVTPLEQRSTDTTCGCAARFRECRRACRTRSLRASPCAVRRASHLCGLPVPRAFAPASASLPRPASPGGLPAQPQLCRRGA